VTQSGDHLSDELLSAHADDQLGPDELASTRAHIESCHECQQRLHEFRSVATLLRRLPDVDLPRDFLLGPRPMVDPPNVVRLRGWYTATRVAAASLAALFVGLFAASLYVDSRPAQPAAQPLVSRPIAAEAPALQQRATQASSGAAANAPAANGQVPAPAAGRAEPPVAPAAAAQSAPAAAAARSAAIASPQPDDQVAAATSVSPLPTPFPTLPPPAVVQTAVAQTALASTQNDAAASLHAAVVGTGILAVFTFLAALVVRHLQRSAPRL
jgi:hypothetical protein